MKTLFSYILILLISAPSFHGVAAVFGVDEVDNSEISHQHGFHESVAEADAPCHQPVVQNTHDCCEQAIDAGVLNSADKTDCEHDGCVECSVNCGTGIALLSSPGTHFHIKSQTNPFSSDRLPVAPLQTQIIPPIA